MEAGAPGGAGGPEGGERQPSEEEIRAALDEQMKQVRVEDLVLQSVASLINLTARRIAKEDERDLEQAKAGIDAAAALAEVVPEEPGRQLKHAISELQLLYAKHSEGGEAGGEGGSEQQDQPGGGGGSGLWTPGGSS